MKKSVKKSAVPARKKTGGLSQALESAQAQAIKDAYAEGITDPKIHSERMQEARERVKAEFAAQ